MYGFVYLKKIKKNRIIFMLFFIKIYNKKKRKFTNSFQTI